MKVTKLWTMMSDEERHQESLKFSQEREAFRKANPDPEGWEPWMMYIECSEDMTTAEKEAIVQEYRAKKTAEAQAKKA